MALLVAGAAAVLLAAGGVPGTAGAGAATGPASPYSSVTGLSVQLSNTAGGATGVTYTVEFRTSAGGALVGGAGTVTLVGPPGTVFSSAVTVGRPGTHVAPAGAQVTIGAWPAMVMVTVPFDVPASSEVRLTLTGAQNAAGGPQQLAVLTSSDVAPAAVGFSLGGPPKSLPTVSDVSLSPSSESAGAAEVNWAISFTVPAGGALAGGSSEVLLRAPPGTRFRGQASIVDKTSGQSGGAAGVDGSFGVLGGGSVAEIGVPFDVHAGDRVVVTPVVTNPAPGGGQLLVSTTADPGWVSVPVQTLAASSVSNFEASPSSRAAGASNTTLTFKFKASATGGLVPGQASILLEGPPGTDFLAQGDVTDTTTKASGGFNGTYGTGGTAEGGRLLSAVVPVPIHAGDGVEVHVRAANPGAGDGTYSLTTTSDRLPATATVRFTQPTSVISPQVSLTTAGGTTTAHFTFRTSSQGALLNSLGEIEILGPPGTVFSPTGSITDSTSGASTGPTGLTLNAGTTWGPEADWLPFFVPFDIGAGDKVTVTDVLATAPAASGAGFVVETTSDTAPATASYTGSGPAATPPVAGAHVDCGGEVAAGTTGATCTVRFTVPPGGPLAAGTGTIAVVGPADFAMSSGAAQVEDLTRHTSAAVSGIHLLGIDMLNADIATFVVPVAIGGGDAVMLTMPGVDLPPEPGPVPLSISTSADATPATATFSTVAVGGLSIRSAGESTSAPGASGVTYTTVFRASGTGRLVPTTGTINLIGPPGVDFSQVNSAVVTDLTTHGSANANVTPAGDNPVLGLTTPVPIAPGDLVKLVVTGIVNPPAPGGSFSLTTSSDAFVVAVAPVAGVITNKWVSRIAASLATPSQAFEPARSIPANVGIAGLVALFLSWPSSLFNQTFQENEEAILAWWDRRARRLRGQKWFRRLAGAVHGRRAGARAGAGDGAAGDGAAGDGAAGDGAAGGGGVAGGGAGDGAEADAGPSTGAGPGAGPGTGTGTGTGDGDGAGSQGGTPARVDGKPEEGGELRTFAAVFLAGALLASFNDPSFLTSLRSLVTFPSVVASMAFSIALPASVALAYHRHRYKSAPWKWHALPTGLAVAAACVLFSRLTGFEPGYLYGIVLGVAFSRKLGRRPQGHIAFLTMVAALVVAVAAWFGWVPVSEAANSHPGSVGLGFADDILAMMFIGGLVGSFFSLIPIKSFSGFAIRRWDFRAWISLYLVVVFLMVQVLLRPVTRANLSTSHAPLVGTVVAFLVASAASVAFFEHFENKRRAAQATVTVSDEAPAMPALPVGRLRHLVDAAFGSGDEGDGDEVDEDEVDRDEADRGDEEEAAPAPVAAPAPPPAAGQLAEPPQEPAPA